MVVGWVLFWILLAVIVANVAVTFWDWRQAERWLRHYDAGCSCTRCASIRELAQGDGGVAAGRQLSREVDLHACRLAFGYNAWALLRRSRVLARQARKETADAVFGVLLRLDAVCLRESLASNPAGFLVLRQCLLGAWLDGGMDPRDAYALLERVGLQPRLPGVLAEGATRMRERIANEEP